MTNDKHEVESAVSALVSACAQHRVSLGQFKKRFLALHAAMPDGLPDTFTRVVDDLFWAVESYVAEPALRSAGDTGDDELRAAILDACDRLADSP